MSVSKNTATTASNRREAFAQLGGPFSHLPGLELGATNSAHEVFFGRYGKEVVAVKPYVGDNAPGRARHEQLMLQLIRAAGFLSLQPVKVLVGKGERDAFLLTKYVPNLTSMAAVVQSRGDAGKLVHRTAKTIAELHREGISHGDAQIKNFALFPQVTDRIAVIDPEKGGTDEGGHYKGSPYLHDLESYVQSLAYSGYGGPNPNQAGDTILQDVIEPYVEIGEASGVPDAHSNGERALFTFLDKHNAIHTKYKVA